MEPRWLDPDLTDQVRDFLAPLPPVPGKPTQAEHGPSAGRPIVAEISLDPDYREYIPLFGHHLKEIRPLGTDIRILCTFTADRTLVLLYIGDKAGDWKRWYRRAIPEAARLYIEYLREIAEG